MTRKFITVFGGSGFIGRHLVNHLATEGWFVRVAVRDIEAAAFLKPLGKPGQITPWPVDVLDLSQVILSLNDSYAAVNLVGALLEKDRYTFENLHAEGAKNIALAAKETGCRRLIHISALGARENSNAKYSRTKAQGELITSRIFSDATIVRPSVVFGPQDKFFNLFAGLMRFLPAMFVVGAPFSPKIVISKTGDMKIDILGDGGPKFQPIYVGDVVSAILAILKNFETVGKIYELGGPTQYSFAEIFQLVLRITGRKRILLPMPFWLAKFQAYLLSLLPEPILTCDQVELLKTDNLVSNDALGLIDLGVELTPAEVILPTYLYKYGLKANRGLYRD